MKKHNLSSLCNVNIELTSRCNKDCWMCGRRKIDKEYPEISMNYGDMDFGLLKKIAKQLPENIVVQLHNNGEALLYPHFGDAVKLFKKQTTNIVTNGKLLIDKSEEIIDNLDTMAISVFENDYESEKQYKIIEEFLKIKGDKKPYTILRINGDVDTKKYEKFGIPLARRVLHAPMGSFNYKKDPTIPEIGICLDFLNHLSINKDGDASICVRFDPNKVGVLGNINEQTIEEIWNGKKRMEWMGYHKQGRRDLIPLCSYCQFWGVPTSGSYTNKNITLDENKVII